MTCLTVLLLVKVLVSMFWVINPLLRWPVAKLRTFARVETKHPLFFRLYGVAMMALVAGYTVGMWQAQAGVFPWSVAITGWVSNTGAALLLLRLPPKSAGFRLGMFFCAVAVGLTMAMLNPAASLTSCGEHVFAMSA